MVKEAGEAKAGEGGRKKKVVASISRAILFNKKDSLHFHWHERSRGKVR